MLNVCTYMYLIMNCENLDGQPIQFQVKQSNCETDYFLHSLK